jgi:hypothetical protein
MASTRPTKSSDLVTGFFSAATTLMGIAGSVGQRQAPQHPVI